MYDIKNVSISTFGECDGFHANRKWGAVPLGGPGGMIAIIDVSDTKRAFEIIKIFSRSIFCLDDAFLRFILGAKEHQINLA